MSAHFTTPTDEMLLLAETLGEVKTKTEKLEAEFSTQARPLEAATNALSAALSGIKALQFHVLDNNLGALSARVEEMRKAVDEQVGVIALELKKADETNAAKAGQEADALRSEIAALQAQLGTLGAQFAAQLERVEFSAKEEAKKLQLIPGPAGAAGASLNPRGTFIDGETYNRLDVVSWLGSSYIAAVDGVTEKPSKNSNQWQVLASRGSGGSGGAGDFGSLAGVAQINQGGTGQTTRAAGLNALLPDQAGATQYMLLTDGAGTVSWGAQPVAGLPSQTSNSGKLLTTDGTNASWSNAVTVSGSNATVTGTLTAGDNVTIPNAKNFVVRNAAASSTAIRMYADSSDFGYIDCTANTELRLQVGAGTKLSITNTGNVSIPSTTASTTTSTGALVVGGGVGIAKALFAGESAYFAGAVGATDAVLKNGFGRSANGYAYFDLVGDTTYTDYGMRLLRGNSGANAISQIAHRGTGTLEVVTVDAAPIAFFTNGSNLALTITSGQQVQCNATTASTSTSTGALVVSGGVGVAGAIHSGNNIRATGNLYAGDSSVSTGAVSIQVGDTRTGSGFAHLDLVGDTTYSDYGFRLIRGDGGANTTSSLLHRGTGALQIVTEEAASILLRTASTTALTITSAQKAEFASTIKTAAPSGGTAAEWKLGTVASVSPTSPNRTIEVDIGGTIYYIHAKTTNN